MPSRKPRGRRKLEEDRYISIRIERKKKQRSKEAKKQRTSVLYEGHHTLDRQDTRRLVRTKEKMCTTGQNVQSKPITIHTAVQKGGLYKFGFQKLVLVHLVFIVSFQESIRVYVGKGE